MVKLRTKLITFSATCICMLLLAGCGLTKNNSESGLSISDDGGVEATIVEDFDTAFYDVDELRGLIAVEVAEYNSNAGTDVISEKSTELTDDGKVCVIMNYADADTYATFNGRNLYVETVKEAIEANMFGINLLDTSGNRIEASEIDEPDKYNVVITDEAGVVICPGKILYISDGVAVTGKKKATVSEDMDGLAYIIYAN